MEGKDGRSERATSKRRQDQRSKGNLAVSQEVISVAVLLGATILLRKGFPMYLSGTRDLLQTTCLNIAARETWSGIGLQTLYWKGLFAILQRMAPLLLGIVTIGIVSSVGQTGPYFSWQAFQAGGLKALDPVKGCKRLFSTKSLTTLGMTLLKIALICGIIELVWHAKWFSVAQLGEFSLESSVLWIGNRLYLTLMSVSALAIALAALDIVITRRQHEKNMMMTKQEVKDERKQYEMKPEVKRAQYRKMRALTFSRLVAEVPKSTVIITNPTRVAIAIRYEPATMDAPKVVAKGLRLRAKRIRELAKAHGIPIVERPPLARTLYRTVPVGRAIPASLFEGVAEVLAYLHRLGHRLKGMENSATASQTIA